MSERQNRRHYEQRRAESIRGREIPKGFRASQPDAKCPDCGAPWQPVCTTRGCPGQTIPKSVLRRERQDGRRYDRRYER